jgi:hypothetical protein
MRNIRFFSIDRCRDDLFNYPCIDSNGLVFADKRICIFDEESLINPDIFSKAGGTVFINPSNKETSFSNVGIIAPNTRGQDTEDSYFDILNYYIEHLQLLIHKQKGLAGFKHILVVLPVESDKCSTKLNKMAFYSVYGLIKGLGEMYARYGLYINGLILPTDTVVKNKTDIWIKFLTMDNSNNIVGQVIKI